MSPRNCGEIQKALTKGSGEVSKLPSTMDGVVAYWYKMVRGRNHRSRRNGGREGTLGSYRLTLFSSSPWPAMSLRLRPPPPPSLPPSPSPSSRLHRKIPSDHPVAMWRRFNHWYPKAIMTRDPGRTTITVTNTQLEPLFSRRIWNTGSLSR